MVMASSFSQQPVSEQVSSIGLTQRPVTRLFEIVTLDDMMHSFLNNELNGLVIVCENRNPGASVVGSVANKYLVFAQLRC